ncbi:MAG: DMT family transporter [Pseudomonadota bacterium]
MSGDVGQKMLLGVLLVALAAISISFSNILAPVVTDGGVSVQTLIVIRFSFFAIACGIWLTLRRVPLMLGRASFLHAIGAGAAYTIGSGSLVAAFVEIPVSLAVLIFYSFPLLTLLGECFFDRRWPAVREIGFLLAALLGLGLCLGIGIDQLNGAGLAFAVLAALGVAGSYLWSGRKLRAVPSTVMTFYMALTGWVMVAALATATASWTLPSLEVLPLVLLAAAVLTFAAAFFGMFAGVSLIGPSRGAMIMNLEPVFTVGLAVWLLAESLTAHQVAGAALVVAAVFAAQWRRS